MSLQGPLAQRRNMRQRFDATLAWKVFSDNLKTTGGHHGKGLHSLVVTPTLEYGREKTR